MQMPACWSLLSICASFTTSAQVCGGFAMPASLKNCLLYQSIGTVPKTGKQYCWSFRVHSAVALCGMSLSSKLAGVAV